MICAGLNAPPTTSVLVRRNADVCALRTATHPITTTAPAITALRNMYPPTKSLNHTKGMKVRRTRRHWEEELSYQRDRTVFPLKLHVLRPFMPFVLVFAFDLGRAL